MNTQFPLGFPVKQLCYWKMITSHFLTVYMQFLRSLLELIEFCGFEQCLAPDHEFVVLDPPVSAK